MTEGTAEVAFCPEVQPLLSEVVVTKSTTDPFIGTQLSTALISIGATELYLGGVSTTFVVESAARHAADVEFRVSVIEDICAAQDELSHRFAVEGTLLAFATITEHLRLLESLGSEPI
jgi:nicotinamidase-related amidase